MTGRRGTARQKETFERNIFNLVSGWADGGRVNAATKTWSVLAALTDRRLLHGTSSRYGGGGRGDAAPFGQRTFTRKHI